MPDSDVRADFEISSLSETSGDSATKIKLLDQAIEKYPESARLYFRRGALGKDQQSSEMLRKASELDPSNALPLYILASRAMSRGSADEAVALLAEGNRRSRVDEYPLSYDIAKGDPQVEIAITTANSQTRFPTFAALRRLALPAHEYAVKLHAAGRTERALAIIGETKQMGRKLIRSDDATLMDVLVGVAIIRICHKGEDQIYTETNSQSGLAQLEQERSKLTYLSAGPRAYLASAGKRIPKLMSTFSALTLPPIYIAFLQAVIMVVSLVAWGVLALVARRKPASELHPGATARAFTAGRLLRMYALILLPLGIAASVLVYLAISGGHLALLYVSLGAAACVPCLLLWWTNASYKKAYRAAAEAAEQETLRLWKGTPIQEKREVARRIVGVQGGMMLFLVLCGLLLSGGAKVTMGAYLWQSQAMRVIASIHEEERQYTADLVAGKIKVPQRYIDEEKQKQDRQTKPSDGATPK